MKFLTDYGLWKVDEIKIRVINEHLAWIDYEKHEVNAERYRNVVSVGFIDRWKGMTLEQKINNHIVVLKNKLEQDNEKIRKFKAIESKFN